MAGILHNPKQCSQCGAPDSQFKCSCKQVYYCGAECQNKDWKQHKSKCAVILSQKVKDMKKECGKDHLAVALARMDFSKSLYEHGQFGDAEKGYLEARRIVKDVIDKHGGVMDGSVGRRGEEVVADLCGQLGALYSDTGRYDEAHKSWEESLKITRERCGERSEETAQAFQGIGSVFARQRNYKEALARTESALDIFTELGLQRSIAGTLCAKGIINRNLCQFGEAAKVMEEAREIYLKHPSTNPMGDKELATLLHSIACVYDQQGLFDKARQDFEAALELYRRLHGEKHPKVRLPACRLLSCSLTTFCEEKRPLVGHPVACCFNTESDEGCLNPPHIILISSERA